MKTTSGWFGRGASFGSAKEGEHARRRRRGLEAVRCAVEGLESRTLLSATLFGPALNYPLGSFNDTGLSLNGGTSISNKPYAPRLSLTDGGANEAHSAFTTSKLDVTHFSTVFGFTLTNASANGFTFALQGSSPTAVGGSGSGLGYVGIGNSIAVEFNIANGVSQTALATNGVAGSSTDLSASGINLHSGDQINVHMEYDGSTLTVTETDQTTGSASATQTYTNVNIPAAVGGSTAYLGFTGGTGAQTAKQEITNWLFADVPPSNIDIGSPAKTGSATFTAGTYSVTGGGVDTLGTSDQLHFVSRALSDSGTVIAQVLSQQNTSPSAEAGVEIRDGLGANASYALVAITPSGAIFQSRNGAGATATSGGTLAATAPSWVKLVRNGPTISGYVSPTGADGTWTLVGTTGIKMASTVQAGLAVTSNNASGTSTATFANVNVHADPLIGVDTGEAGIYSQEQEQMWVDVIKQATAFAKASDAGTLAASDASGNPLEDFQSTVLTALPNNLGTYHLSMVVSQNPTIVFSSGVTVTNQVYNAATHTVTADVNINAPSGAIKMTVTNTGGGASNIHLIRPGYDPSNPPVFTTNYLNFLKAVHPNALRFMNFLSTNDNPVRSWSQRTLPSDATQTQTTPLLHFDNSVDFAYQSLPTANYKGIAWEYAIMLANAVHSDMWINIPSQADDNYITQLANLIKNGDTVNGVHYAGLSPDLNVYIEYTNEAWNAGNASFHYDYDAATTEVINGQKNGTPSNLNYDNLSTAVGNNGYVSGAAWAQRFYARRLVQISNLFGGVFGQNAINTRIRTVISDFSTSRMQDMLKYVNANYGPPSNFLYGAGDVIYLNQYGPNLVPNTVNGGVQNPNLTPDQVLQNLAANASDPANLFGTYDALAAQYGLKALAYEGGFDTSGPQNQGANGSIAIAERDPRVIGITEQYLQTWFARGGDQFMYFTAGAGTYGFKFGDFVLTEDITKINTPKIQGLNAAESTERSPRFPSAPTSLSITGSASTQVNLSWTDTANDAAFYRIDASNSSDFSTNLITRTISATSTTYAFTGLLPGIKYYFRVRGATSAGDSANSPTATITTPGTLTSPAAPSGVSASAVSNSQVNLAWNDNSFSESGFHVDVATDPNFTQNLQTLTAPVDATHFSVFGLNQLTTYYFRIRAFNNAGDSSSTSAVNTGTLAATPVAYYGFDEASGTTANDAGSGTPDNGTINGGVTRVAGRIGSGALSFDGSTGYVELGQPSKLNFSGQITVSAWIKPTAISGTETIVGRGNDGINAPYYLRVTSSNSAAFGSFRSTGGGLHHDAVGTISGSLTDGNWHHLAGVYDGLNFRVYVDGALIGTLADPYGITKGSEPVNIGRDTPVSAPPTNYYNGAIDEVRIYNTGLSAADIAALASANQPPPTIPTAPTLLTAKAVSASEIDLGWQDNSNNETGFKVLRSTDGTHFSLVTTTLPGATSFNDTGLASGTKYFYEVIATNSAGDSSPTNIASDTTSSSGVTTPAAPGSLNASAASATEIDLTWQDNSNNETGFKVDRATNANFTQNLTLLTTTQAGVTSFADTGLSPSSTYFYRVRATNSAGDSTNSNTAVATTQPVTVVVDNSDTAHVAIAGNWTPGSSIPGFIGSNYLYDFNPGGTDSVKFSPALPAAGQYQVLVHLLSSSNRATNAPIDVIAADGVHTFMENEQQTPAGWYSLGTFNFNATGAAVTIRAAGANGYVTADAVQFTTGLPSAPAAPTGVNAAAVSGTEVNVSWVDNSNNEDGFSVEQSPNGSNWTVIGSTLANATNFDVTGLTPGATYFYRVRAFNSGGNSAYGDAQPVTTPSATTDIIVDNADSAHVTFTGNWAASSGVAGFFGSNYLFDNNPGANDTVLFSPQLPGAGNYQVYAWWAAAPNRASNVPIDINASDGIHTVFENQQINGGHWVLLGTYNFASVGASVGIRTTGASGYVVADAIKFTPVTGTSTPASPTALHSTAVTSTQISLAWTDNSSNETGFKIERSTDNVNWAPAGSVGANVTTFTDTGLHPSTTYFYRVTATNGSGDSAPATSAAIQTQAPAPIIVDNTDTGHVAITGNWAASSGTPGFFGTNYLYDINSTGPDSVTYTPPLPAAGTYNVFARWTAASNRATNAPIQVNAADGAHTILENEQTNGGQWVLLGTYTFNATGGSVTILTKNAAGYVVADAVEFTQA